MNIIKNILLGTLALLLMVGCNRDEEFINPFTDEEGFANLAAFVRFEETPGIVASGEIDFDQLSSLAITGDVVDPAGNVQSYDLRVALNPSDDEEDVVEDYAPLLTLSNFQEDVPVAIAIGINDITTALGIEVSALEAGDVLDFEAIVTRDDGATFTVDNLTGDVFNLGQRQAISFSIEIEDSRPVPSYFTLVSDAAGAIALGDALFSEEEVDAVPLTEGDTRTIYVRFDSPLQTPPSFSVDTANGGSFSPVEAVTLVEDGEDVTSYRTVFTAGSIPNADVEIGVSGATETAEAGGETMAPDSFTITVDNVPPAYTLSYSAPATDTGYVVVITATFSEAVRTTPPPTIVISGQGIVPIESEPMDVVSDLVATYTFSPAAEGEVTEGPLAVTVNAVDLVGNVAEVEPDNPVLEISRP
jgi:hypothetical protein